MKPYKVTYEVEALLIEDDNVEVLTSDDRDEIATHWGVYERRVRPEHNNLPLAEWLADFPTRKAAEDYARLMRKKLKGA